MNILNLNESYNSLQIVGFLMTLNHAFQNRTESLLDKNDIMVVVKWLTALLILIIEIFSTGHIEAVN